MQNTLRRAWFHGRGRCCSSLPKYSELQLTPHAGGGVLLAELHRPQSLNAFSERMGEEIIDLCKWVEASKDPLVRCLVVTGGIAKNGKRAFSTGRDLKLSEGHTTESQKQFYLSKALESVLAVKRSRVVTIGVVVGPAFGWGVELATACDLRIFDPGATICFPETRLGLFPGAAGTVLLPQLVPAAVAKEMIYTAARYSGEEAAAKGLGRVADDPIAEALSLASTIAANAPLGLRGAKEVLDASIDGDFARSMEMSRKLRPALTDSEDFQEGLASFREKRAPVFRGR